MNKQRIIIDTENYVRQTLESAHDPGHDWSHIERVRTVALKIARKETSPDLFTVELAALLHDIADWKFHGGDDAIGANTARAWLEKNGVNYLVTEHVGSIVEHISFKGAQAKNKITTLEGKIVQDADRLDALGAIGVARAFSYGGYKQRPLHDATIGMRTDVDTEQYKQGSPSTLHHFYEKVLHLRDLMNTKTGKEIANKRHMFTNRFIKEFLAEWDGKR